MTIPELSYAFFTGDMLDNIVPTLLPTYGKGTTVLDFRFQTGDFLTNSNQRQGYTLLMVKDHDVLVCLAELIESNGKTKCTLEAFEILPAYRQRGYGHTIFNHLLERHAKTRRQAFFLECTNLVLPFYQSAVVDDTNTYNGKYAIVSHIFTMDETLPKLWNGLTIQWIPDQAV